MKRRIWLGLAMLAAGLGLLVAASLASAGGKAPQLKNGGVFRVGVAIPPVVIDPQKAYNPIAWQLSYATGANLYTYPDKPGMAGMRLVPEVASKFTVSNNGKTYTFFIRKGFRFSDGKPVTAANFEYAIDRVLNRKLASNGAQFITDEYGTRIVGAAAVAAGKAEHAKGVVVKGDRLIIHLWRPDPTFLGKIAMPFFQATSTKLPRGKWVVEVAHMGDLPSAGPYTFALNGPGKPTLIRRNRFWTRGPGRNRPRHLSGVRVEWNTNAPTAFQQVMANDLDLAIPVPADQIPGLARDYGVNKTRFWVKPNDCTGWLVTNTSRELFRNVSLRKALNYAVDRSAYIRVLGPYAGRPWSHILNPGVPGWRSVQPYPLRPNLTRARKLAGSLDNTKINVWYVKAAPYFPGGPEQFTIIQRDLIRLGFKPENINAKGFSDLDIFNAMSVRDNDADLGVSMGWCSDFRDPYDWINVNFYGKSIRESGNLNMSYFNSRKWDRRMERAARLTGDERLRAYGRLDIDLMREAAPLVPMETLKSVSMFSKRVDPRSLVWQRIYVGWSIPALALK